MATVVGIDVRGRREEPESEYPHPSHYTHFYAHRDRATRMPARGCHVRGVLGDNPYASTIFPLRLLPLVGIRG